MATIIQLRDPPFTDACPAPDRCGGCGAATWHGHGRVPRTVTDLGGDRTVSVRRYRCQACGRTVTVAPAGPGRPGAGGHAGETWIPIGGGKRPVAVVTDAADGAILQLAVSDGDFDWQAWLAPLADWGVEVVVTDDDSAYGGPLEAHGLDRRQCMVHMRRTFARRLRKLPEEVRERHAPRLKRLRRLLRELPAEGTVILMGWLEEAVDPAAPAPKEWRSLVQHFPGRRTGCGSTAAPRTCPPPPTAWKAASDG